MLMGFKVFRRSRFASRIKLASTDHADRPYSVVNVTDTGGDSCRGVSPSAVRHNSHCILGVRI